MGQSWSDVGPGSGKEDGDGKESGMASTISSLTVTGSSGGISAGVCCCWYT